MVGVEPISCVQIGGEFGVISSWNHQNSPPGPGGALCNGQVEDETVPLRTRLRRMSRAMATTEEPRAGAGARTFSTISGIDVDPLYTPGDAAIDYERDLGYPGEYPYTRGVYP